jgi:hypothetical protein
LASRVTLSLAFHETSRNAPEAAELVFSQPFPKSPLVSCASATFFSTTEATMDVIRLSTRDGARSAVIVKLSVSPLAFTRSLTLAFDQPSWVMRKAGVLAFSTTRCRENSASSAVTGAPEWNLRFGRILKVKVLPSGDTVQDSATPPTSLVMSSASKRSSRS